jgi:hypothetical protein
MPFLVYSGETAPERPSVDSETFLEVDIHLKDALKTHDV